MESGEDLRRSGKVRNAIRASLWKAFRSVSVLPMAPLGVDEVKYTLQLRQIGGSIKQHCRVAHRLFGESATPVTAGNLPAIMTALTQSAAAFKANFNYAAILGAAQFAAQQLMVAKFASSLKAAASMHTRNLQRKSSAADFASLPEWILGTITTQPQARGHLLGVALAKLQAPRTMSDVMQACAGGKEADAAQAISASHDLFPVLHQEGNSVASTLSSRRLKAGGNLGMKPSTPSIVPYSSARGGKPNRKIRKIIIEK